MNFLDDPSRIVVLPVSVNTINGLTVQGSGCTSHTVEGVKPYTRHLKFLAVNALPNDAQKYGKVLDEDMPLLERLSIGVDFSKSGRTYNPPTFSLRARKFPKLYTVQVLDAFVRLEQPMYANLRSLQLDHSQNGRNRMPLADFLNVVRSCTRLEKLHITRYVDPTASRDVPPRFVLSLAQHRQLYSIHIGDSPHIVSGILSHLMIPSHIAVTVSGFTDTSAHTAFRAMLPNDLRNLPVILQAGRIELNDSPIHGRSFSASLNNSRRGSFMMELRTLDGHDCTEVPDERIGPIFCAMALCTDIFQRSPVKKIVLHGPLKAMTRTAWVAMLDRLHSVQELEVEDSPYQPSGSLDAFLRALSSPSALHPGMRVCPNLQSLKLRGATHGAQAIDAVARCLAERVQAHMHPPRSLKLNLYPDGWWRSAEVETYRQNLAQFAAEVTLRINHPDDDQEEASDDAGEFHD
ncbi:hypothetical protein C8Q77DRAFT_1160594 [Trametes polyzona]|nr:hypothetical protein C8Q77DRAFT_1160594 [Trametes polyzona]